MLRNGKIKIYIGSVGVATSIGLPFSTNICCDFQSFSGRIWGRLVYNMKKKKKNGSLYIIGTTIVD